MISPERQHSRPNLASRNPSTRKRRRESHVIHDSSRPNTSDSYESTMDAIEKLPAHQHRQQLLQAMQDSRVVICVGETGSGKTTQIPQFILEYFEEHQCDDSKAKLIGVTQPRRVATISVANRVTEEIEMFNRKNKEIEKNRESIVGYTIRFEDATSDRTIIKFMTDGVLVRECLKDPLLSRYRCIILDEAHERSIHTDILFGLLKALIPKRSDLKILITSATLDDARFASFFATKTVVTSDVGKLESCPVIKIPGRAFPVEIFHSKAMQMVGKQGPISAYVRSAIETTLQVHNSEPPGHILVFLTGQKEIEDACEQIRQYYQEQERDRENPLRLAVYPLYGSLTSTEQRRIFEPVDESAVRKVIVATNIAETSLTIDGIRYVVDSGFTKQKVYDPARQIESLVIVPISRVAAQQRAGRAGRTGPGKCFRLYSKECYERMMEETIPEIQRTNLANTMLYLKVLGIHNVLDFQYVDPPDHDAILDALKQLFLLGAIDSDGHATEIGKLMAEFPLDPSLSRSAIESMHLNCEKEVLAIVSMLSTDQIFKADHKHHARTQVQQTHITRNSRDADHRFQTLADANLIDELGDQLSFWRILHAFSREDNKKRWCDDLGLHIGGLRMALAICKQLEGIRSSLEKTNAFKVWNPERKSQKPCDLSRRIRKSLCAGYFLHAAQQCGTRSVYKIVNKGIREHIEESFTLQSTLAHLHPLSVLNLETIHSKLPSLCIYHKLVQTSKTFMQHVIGVEAAWIEKYSKPNPSTEQLYALCGIKLAPTTREKKKQCDKSEHACKVPNDAGDKQQAIDEARVRYLARKKSRKV